MNKTSNPVYLYFGEWRDAYTMTWRKHQGLQLVADKCLGFGASI